LFSLLIKLYNDTREHTHTHTQKGARYFACDDDIARYFACNMFLNFQLKAYRGISMGRETQQVSFVTHGNRRKVSPEVRPRRLPWTIPTTVPLRHYCSRVFFVPQALSAASLVSGSSRWRWSEMRNCPLLWKRKRASHCCSWLEIRIWWLSNW